MEREVEREGGGGREVERVDRKMMWREGRGTKGKERGRKSRGRGKKG